MHPALRHYYYYSSPLEALPEIEFTDNYYLLDTFTGADGTVVNTSRSPDEGNNPSTITAGTHTIQSNSMATTVAAGLVVTNVGVADYVIECVRNISNTSASMRIDFRYGDAVPTTTHRLIVDFSGGNVRLREFNGDGGTPTNTWTAAQALTANKDYTTRIEAVGSLIKVYVNNTLKLTQTVAITTGNFVGILGETVSTIQSVDIHENIANDYLVLDYTAHCWFARQKAIYNASAQRTWIGQVHNNGTGYSQHIVTLNNATGAASTVKVGTVVEDDDHNEPSILVRSSDNKLFTCYTEHGGSVLRWRISTNALDASAWGAESTLDPDAGDTFSYLSCFEASNGDIFMIYRKTVDGWAYVKSTNGGVAFGSETIFFFGEGARGYLTFAQSPLDADVIHMVGTGGHPINVTKTSVYAFYFDMGAETVHKLDGTDVTAEMPLTGAADMTLLMDNTLPDTGWIEDIIVDNTGKPRYLLTFHPNGQNVNYLTKDLYYCEWDGSAVTTPVKIHTAAVKQMETDGTITQGTYPPNSCFDVSDPNIIIASKEVSGVCELHHIRRNSSSSFTSTQITFNSRWDQWRPFTVNHTQRNLFWLNKKSYPDYIASNQQLLTATI